MPRMRWVRLWTQETLYGTTNRELTLEERAIWFELLCLAGDSSEPGTICVSPGVSFTEHQLSGILGAPPATLRKAIAKLTEVNKVSVNGTGCIQIVNWDRYQGFDRQEYQKLYMVGYRNKERKTNSKPSEGETNSKPSNRREGKGGEKTRSTTPHPSPHKKQQPQNIRVSSLGDDPVFLQELAVKFPQLDIHLELVACDDHWGNRVKAPKKAFINWLQRAVQFRAERSNDGRPGTNRSVPGNRPAGAFADLADN
ncbi:hypothetical protein LCGC14_1627060 [marine sediment metagenome]|uniref:Phage replisome organiser N-terminal domain-containing protein n=1 Tax=marine sediment metagenome TaxID=412755 RepID=A0A0F9KJD6_9ZZZZ